MPYSADSPLMTFLVSEHFMIFSGICGTLMKNIFLHSSAIKRRKLLKERSTAIKLLTSKIPPLFDLSTFLRIILFLTVQAVPLHSFSAYTSSSSWMFPYLILLDPSNIALAGDGTPVRTSARMRYKKACKCSENGTPHCNCKRKFSQPDCNIGWDSSRDCYFNGYHLYMFVASDSENDLPVFPLLERASRHDMLSFLHTFFQ